MGRKAQGNNRLNYAISSRVQVNSIKWEKFTLWMDLEANRHFVRVNWKCLFEGQSRLFKGISLINFCWALKQQGFGWLIHDVSLSLLDFFHFLWRWFIGNEPNKEIELTFLLLRFTSLQIVEHETSENWTLQIKFAQLRDSGIYECQVTRKKKRNDKQKINKSIEWLMNFLSSSFSPLFVLPLLINLGLDRAKTVFSLST